MIDAKNRSRANFFEQRATEYLKAIKARRFAVGLTAHVNDEIQRHARVRIGSRDIDGSTQSEE